MGIRIVGIREQGAWIRSRYPAFRYKVAGGLLLSRGEVQPTPMSHVYAVEVLYRVGKWPKAFVPHGQLRPLEPGGRIPHTYGTAEPCLFYPSVQSWRSDMRLADTLIPWLCVWLAFYEMWRATGEWYGGGISHGEVVEIEHMG
jgi:hypothetical protein